MHPRASAGGIIVGPDKRIILVEQHGNSWSFPKGGIEAGESALEAAIREIAEETGITDLALVEELGTYERYSIGLDGRSENRDWGLRPRTLFLFTTNANDGEHKQSDEEVTKIGRFTFDEAVARLTHPKDKEFLESVRAKVEKIL